MTSACLVPALVLVAALVARAVDCDGCVRRVWTGLDLAGRFGDDFLAGFGIGISVRLTRRRAAPPKPRLGQPPAGHDPKRPWRPKLDALPLQWLQNASGFWIILLLSSGDSNADGAAAAIEDFTANTRLRRLLTDVTHWPEVLMPNHRKRDDRSIRSIMWAAACVVSGWWVKPGLGKM